MQTRFTAGERDRRAVGFETGENLTVRIPTQQHHQRGAARPVVRQGPLLQTRPFPREPCCIAANSRHLPAAAHRGAHDEFTRIIQYSIRIEIR